MALSLGLTQAEWDDLCNLCVNHHGIAVTLQLMDLQHNHVSDISSMLLDGSVNIDVDGDTSTRSATLQLLDPKHKLQLDAAAPEDGSLYMTNMIRIIYSIISPDRKRRYDMTIFTGPLVKVSRTGFVLSVDALGKDSLMRGSVWVSKSYNAKQPKTAVMNKIFDAGGEKYYAIANSKAKLPHKVVVNDDHAPFAAIKDIAQSMGWYAWYNGPGTAQVRNVNRTVRFTFRPRGGILNDPVINWDTDNLINAVRVTGGKPKGHKHKVHAKAVAPPGNALSPVTLGRWGVNRYFKLEIDDDSIKHTKAAKELAKSRLRQGLEESLDVQFDCMPIPFLEEYDTCRIVTDDFDVTFRVRKMTIPLTPTAGSMGYIKKILPNKRLAKLRRGRKRRHR